MEKVYKVREAKEYFNSLPDDLLNKNVVVSINTPKNNLCTINGIMVQGDSMKEQEMFEKYAGEPYHTFLYHIEKEFERRKVDKEKIKPTESKSCFLQIKAFHATTEAQQAIKKNEAYEALISLEKAIDLLKSSRHMEFDRSPWDPR